MDFNEDDFLNVRLVAKLTRRSPSIVYRDAMANRGGVWVTVYGDGTVTRIIRLCNIPRYLKAVNRAGRPASVEKKTEVGGEAVAESLPTT